MKRGVLLTMSPESGYWIATTWPLIGKITMASQFVEMVSPSIFFDDVFFPLPS